MPVRLLNVKVIGLTGIFGSGKSTIAGFLKDMGAVIVDADQIVHQLYLPGGSGFQQVVSLFGSAMVDVNCHLDRRKLADIIFADEAARIKLNTAVHPLVTRQLKVLLAEHRRRHTPVVIVEAPLLIEAGWVPLVDEVWVTTAPREAIFRRLNQKYDMSYSSVLARIHAQLPVREQIRHASQVISTDTSLERLKTKTQRLWQGIT
ncbi:MAG: dephospho-CoA kinase [Dehalococcoidia bacterium]|nr:dephospho-CoA kinase [Dehalococcoidia bacterium]